MRLVSAYLALGASACVLAGFAGPLLARCTWLARRPEAGVVLWSAVLVGAVGSVALPAALAVFAPPSPAHRLFEVAVSAPFHPHRDVGLGVVLAVLATALLGAAARIGMPPAVLAARHARRHQQAVELVADRPAEPRDVSVLDHPAPAAYSLASGGRPVVLSRGLLLALDEDELGAVLAHERCHVRWHHHVLLLALDASARAFRILPTFRAARTAVPLLLEMAADAAAARRAGPTVVAAAIRQLNGAGCGGSRDDAVTTRLHGLEHDESGHWWHIPVAVAASVAAVAMPVLALLPALPALPGST